MISGGSGTIESEAEQEKGGERGACVQKRNGIKLWAINSLMCLRQAFMFDSFAMVSGLADIFS